MKSGPKFFSSFKKNTLMRFRAILGRVPEFVYGNENPASREEYNIVKKKGWIEVDNINTNYSPKTIRRWRKHDNEKVYGTLWKTVQQIEKSQPKLLKHMKLVKSAREAWEVYEDPILSCNDAVSFLNKHVKKRPTPEHVFNVLLKLNVRPDQVWPNDLAHCIPTIELLVKIRASIVERKIIRLHPQEALYMSMVAKHGATSSDPFVRDLEDFVKCIFASILHSTGDIDGFFRRVMRANGVLAFDDHIAIQINEGGKSRTYTWSDLEHILEEISCHPEQA